jgi:hypothetical protein
MLRTDEAIIRALHVYAFYRVRREDPLRGPVIRMKISNKADDRKQEVGEGMHLGGEESRDEVGNAFYAVVSEGSDRCLHAVVSIMDQSQQYDGDTDLPRSLFILNMSILSVLNTAFNAPSHMISRPFDGFCRLLDLIYAHSFLTTCGRESESS